MGYCISWAPSQTKTPPRGRGPVARRATQCSLRRREKPRPARAMPKRASVAGSGARVTSPRKVRPSIVLRMRSTGWNAEPGSASASKNVRLQTHPACRPTPTGYRQTGRRPARPRSYPARRRSGLPSGCTCLWPDPTCRWSAVLTSRSKSRCQFTSFPRRQSREWNADLRAGDGVDLADRISVVDVVEVSARVEDHLLVAAARVGNSGRVDRGDQAAVDRSRWNWFSWPGRANSNLSPSARPFARTVRLGRNPSGMICTAPAVPPVVVTLAMRSFLSVEQPPEFLRIRADDTSLPMRVPHRGRRARNRGVSRSSSTWHLSFVAAALWETSSWYCSKAHREPAR